ncbi:protocadherin alpha-2 [Oryzias melastigma]|uniref:protocadherin alpha-2 n=1 Tax=Oryzias melastigma TaxID=30732 RepID=UPI00168D9679|nr:protocadherin alpha-2 [Oryzias melastigma]
MYIYINRQDCFVAGGMLLAVLLCLFDCSAAQLSFSVSEEVDKGTVIGNLAKDLNIVPQQLEERGFRIVSLLSKKYFEVDLRTCALFVNERIDREELCPNTPKCSLNIEGLISSPMNIYRIEVNVLDINGNAPQFLEQIHVFNISESSSAGERYPLPAAHDADTGINSVKTYKLSPNDFFSIDVSTSRDGLSAELVLQKALDREKQPNVRLILIAVRSGTMQIIVNVVDVNDNTPLFSKSLYKVSVHENESVGTTILTLNATDLDEGSNADIRYTLMKRGNVDSPEKFYVVPESGEIVLKTPLNYEDNNAYELRVQASDKGSSPRSGYSKVLIEVVDVNDNAPEITITSVMSPVKENAEIGTVVALVTVTDKDGGQNGVTTCTIKDILPFKLTTNYKNYYSLIVDGLLDRERVAEYNVTIVAVDAGSSPLSGTAVIHVQVSDINDNAPTFSEVAMNVYVTENSQVGNVIAKVTAQDADINDNADITFLLAESNSWKTPISSMLNINSKSGEIMSMQSFDYEVLKTFQFKVQATDSGAPPLSSNVTVNVFVLDENDNSPSILAPYSEHGSVNSENIPYSAEAGYFVAKIRAVDADSGYNALLSYHLSEPKGNNLFRIGTSSGEIRTKRRMSDNDLKSHPLLVLVCDHGEPSLSATVSIEVVVLESSADMQTPFRHVPLKEDSFSDLNLYLLIAIVSVSVIFLLSLISLMAVRCHRTDASFSRYSAPMITTHPDGSWSYSKATQQYDVCFSSDTLKSDVVVFPAPFPPVDAELISINGADTFTRTQTLPNSEKVRTSFL